MPQRKNKETPPPEVMTMRRAMPVLVVAGICDAVRFMFEWFIFFGPALAALYCTVKAGDAIGTTAAGYVCSAGAGIVGVFGAELIGPFGIVMAMITGLAGWMIIGIYLVKNNPRIFKENALWFGGSLLLSEIPFVGSVPALSLILWKMYRTQIRVEKAKLKKWEESQAVNERQERDRQMLQQSQTARQQQSEQQAVLDQEWESQLAQQEEQDEIPETMRGTAS